MKLNKNTYKKIALIFILIGFYIKLGLFLIHKRIKQYYKSVAPSKYSLSSALLKPISKSSTPYTK